MDIVIFIFSYLFLTIIGSLAYVALLLLSFGLMKKVFNMSEEKWSRLFEFGKGRGLFYMVVFPYVLMLAVLFLLSYFWFDFVNVKYDLLAAIAVVGFMVLTFLFKLPKLKEGLQGRYQENR